MTVRLLAALIGVATLWFVALPSLAQSDSAALNDAKSRVQSVRNQLESAKASRANAEAQLADADQRLAEVEAVVNEVAILIENQQASVAEAQAELDRLQDTYVRVREALSLRAAGIYKIGTNPTIEVFLAAQDARHALDRTSYLDAVNRADRATMEDVTNARIAVDFQRTLLEAESARLEQMRVEQEELLALVQQIRDDAAVAAASARARVVELESQKEDLEEDAKRLERLIAAKSRPPTSVAPSTAGYVWPRCDRVTSEYGRRWGRLHAGMDIDGNTGNPIVAAKGGVVIHAGWQGGYGNLVLIDHGDGVVTAYAHQSSVAVTEGQLVARGQRVGNVGSTGNSTGSHLHFETRVNGSAVNPRRFLPGGC